VNTASIKCFALAVLAILTSGAVSAQAADILPPPERVSENVYAWIGPLDGPNTQNQGYRMNLAFVVGTDAVAVFDTGYTREMGDEMIAHIKRVTALPIRYAINSNSQPHRYFGNDAFHAIGAEIMATPEELARMEGMGGMFAMFSAQALGLKDGAVPAPIAPVQKVTSSRTLDLGGGITLRILPAGGNHTPNSLIADVPSDKVLLAGDVLYGERLLAVLDVSQPKEWIDTFDGLRRFKDYLFVPGHGRPGPLAIFEGPTYRYLSNIWDYMCKAVGAGVDLDSAVKSYDQSAYSGLVNFDNLSGRNASWTYQKAEFACF
tara:strand:- start:504 stop:1457 length:954 start_codon:yes stop_codon:yes gene_type:complete